MGRASNRARGNGKPATRRKAQKSADARVPDLEKRLAEAVGQLETRDRELAEAQEQQTATSEILRVISSSPTDYQPVFDTIVRRAGVVCGAVDAVLWIVDGDELVVRAHHGPIRATIGARQPPQGSVAGAAVREARIVHVEDLSQADDFPVGRDLARRLGWRTSLSAPLLRAGVAIGAVLIRRSEVRPFTDRQIALLQTFADEAVIALENVRLFTELQTSNRELTAALEQQTATSEVLRSISASPADAQPVFDTIARSAVQLCEASFGGVLRFDGALIHLVAHHGLTREELQAALQFYPMPVRQGGFGLSRAIGERRIVHVPDVMTDPGWQAAESVRNILGPVAGFHAFLAVPLVRDDTCLGAVNVWRREPGPFSDGQIALLQTFADQAVIAIENVRLFTELKTSNRELTAALEQQTATSEILRAITHAPTDTQPVFDAIVRSAATLCHAAATALFLTDGQRVFARANYGGTPEAQEASRARFPRPLDMESSGGAAILTGSVVHMPDIEELSVSELVRQNVRRLGARSVLTVPMVRDGAAMGAIGVYRREPGRFSNAEVTLLQTFADQAVIAIENVRLFKELEARNRDLIAALDQQTATAEILRVISSSVTDVQPVFDAIVRSAVRLCGASHGGVYRFDGELVHSVAHEGYPPEQLEHWRRTWPRAASVDNGVVCEAVQTREVVRVGDIEATASGRFATEARANLRARGSRSVLAVPMISHDAVVGAIGLSHPGVDAFSDAHLELLRTFADQAVIAIQNVRLFTELGEKNRALTAAHSQVTETLEQQTATSEILRVISTSPTDTQSVFDTIIRNAVRLLEGFSGVVTRRVDEELHLAALTSTNPSGDAAQKALWPKPMAADRSVHAQVITRLEPCVITDVESDGSVPPEEVGVARARGYRSIIAVPLVREGRALGSMAVTRRTPGPFSDGEIALLKTFADQAVIAIENVRMFTELQASNKHLTDALDKQTATSDILRVISRSQTDVQPVFEAILSSAVRLLGADTGALSRVMDDQIELAAFTRTDDAGAAALRAGYPQSLQSDLPHAQAIRARAPLNIADAQTDPRLPEDERGRARVRGFRGRVLVPLLRRDEAIGAISVARVEPGGFNADEISLLQTFADQAVIAIENARLLTALQARTQDLTRSVEQLTALGEVGRAVSSTLNLETVLTTIVSRAVELSGLDGGVVFEYDEGTEEFVHRVATEASGALAEARRSTRVRKGEGVVGQTALTLEPAQVGDITTPGAYESRLRKSLIASGIRAVLAVPMVREGELMGCLVVSRNRPGEFTADTIELLRTFATQSALAIQNARLFREIEIKSRELETASRHKSEFLANMSHELRTPLNAIIGFSEILSERMFGELNEKQDEYLKDIHTSGQHLLSLINDILDLSKIEAGRMELELSAFDLPTTIDNALILVRERAGRRGIALHKTVDGRLGQIQADERKIRQVLLNLLSNAIKFTPEGGRIEVGAQAVNGSIEVSVADTGVGIAPEDQEAVFEEFRQVGSAEKRVEGTGLGLALSRKFIELHGGRISVKSQVGQGSTFTFTIPVRPG